MNEIITRYDAAKLGLVYYFTGRACGRGHISSRYVCSGNCFDCAILMQKKVRAEWSKIIAVGRGI